MKVILKENKEHLGFKDEVVDVKNGYARNYLIPKGIASLATPSAIKMLEENLRQSAVKNQKVKDEVIVWLITGTIVSGAYVINELVENYIIK